MNRYQAKSLVIDYFKQEIAGTVDRLLGDEGTAPNRWPVLRDMAQFSEYIDSEPDAVKADKQINQVAQQIKRAATNVYVGSKKPNFKDYPLFQINADVSGRPITTFTSGGARRYIIRGEVEIGCWGKGVKGYDVLDFMSEAARQTLEEKRILNESLPDNQGKEVTLYTAIMGPVEPDGEDALIGVSIPMEFADRR